MKSENWEKVETIFHQALSFEGAERQKYLEKSCSADAFLLSEVNSLISSFENEAGFLDNSVVDLSFNLINQKNSQTRTGTTLGFYQIGEKLGSGGMGEVYQALDTRLNRKVALKFLPESLKNDNAAKRQLQKEAQAVAMLDHPNICAVHGLEQVGDDNFIVMQFVEGETLETKLNTMQISPDFFKSLAKQIVSAVALAHSHGIIHRDLKPGNIMISESGSIKVLDFGLAKIVGGQKTFGGSILQNSSQVSTNGLVIGTISYMSPEQLRGEKLDYQTDIFSLGIILYELLAKENPFQRETKAEVIAAILSDDSVSAEKISPKPPASIIRLIDNCLAKNKNERIQSTAEILLEFDKIESENLRQFDFKNYGRYFLKIAVPLILFAAIFFALLYFSNSRQPKTLAVLPISFENPPPEKEYLADGLTRSIIDKLSNLSNLKVKNESLVSRYKGTTIEPQTIGKEMKADVVLIGSITRRDEQLFLTTKIVRTSDGILLDAPNEVKIEESNLIAVQESIVSRILDKINSKLTSDDKTRLAKKDSESTEAVDKYLKGRFLLKSRKNSDDVEKAIQNFMDAKDLDQNYAKAWSGLADAYLLQSAPGTKGAVTPEQAFKTAKLAAQKAIELDNTSSESYTSLGLISLRYEWDWKTAETYFRTAINLNPDSLSPRLGLLNVLRLQKRFDEAIVESQKVKEIDPISITYEIQIALIHYRNYDFEQADKILTELKQRFPSDITVKYIHSYILLRTDRFKEAIKILEPLYESSDSVARILPAAPLGFGYAKIGRRNDALRIIKDLEQSRKDNYVPAQEKALIYLGLGEYEKVFEFLDKSCKEKFSALPGWVTDPIASEVWTDPRIDEIQQCVNL
jgi:eukaryotic-like serine/threonine-protein kinase